MAKVRRPISRWYRRKIYSSPLQRFALELHHLFAGWNFVTTQLMPRLVEQRGRQIFCRRETLVELGGGLNLFYKRRRQRFAGLVMPRVIPQHFRPVRPHLIHLRWEFHKIPWNARAAETRKLDR